MRDYHCSYDQHSSKDNSFNCVYRPWNCVLTFNANKYWKWIQTENGPRLCISFQFPLSLRLFRYLVLFYFHLFSSNLIFSVLYCTHIHADSRSPFVDFDVNSNGRPKTSINQLKHRTGAIPSVVIHAELLFLLYNFKCKTRKFST